MPNTAIKVSHLTKVYKLYDKPIDRLKESLHPLKKKYHKDFYALNDVSFEIKKGETVGIIGKNGAGKSTLLKIITGVLTPSSGHVQVNGRIASLLELGAGFNPEYTGIENIYLQGTLMGYTKEEMKAKVDEISAFADIGDFVHQPVKMYSSGMFARLAFAVAINVDPDILIVDEALSVGDFAFQAKCNLYMKEYLSNKTILFVTHDMATVSKMAESAILIDGGKLIKKGEVKEIIQMYTKLLQDKVSYQYYESIDSTDSINSNEWKNILDSSISGKKEILIKAFNITEQALFMANDTVNCKFLIESNKKLENIIFGYFLNDRHGVQIFGETTLSDDQTYNLEEGKYIIELSFIWPEIKEGSYFLNFGIGMGINPLVHEIQCWAQNIHEIRNTDNGASIHGIFNNKMQSFIINKGV